MVFYHTHLVMKSKRQTKSTIWLQMPWLLISPIHQQSWYWLYRINRTLSSTHKGFNNLCHLGLWEIIENANIFLRFLKQILQARLTWGVKHWLALASLYNLADWVPGSMASFHYTWAIQAEISSILDMMCTRMTTRHDKMEHGEEGQSN